MKALSILLVLATLKSLKAVNIKVQGFKKPPLFTALLYNATTFENDPSHAKIEKVDSILPSNSTLGSIQVLTLTDPNTKFLPFDLFFTFPNVKVLHVEIPGQNMKGLVQGHFKNATKLEKVFITGQKISKLGPRIFEGAHVLSWIYLDENLIEIVDENTFHGEIFLVNTLSLESNLISSLTCGVFSLLPELLTVVLSSNLLTTLPNGLFEQNKKLKKVELTANRLLNVQIFNDENIQPGLTVDMRNNLCFDDTITKGEVDKNVSKKCKIELPPIEIYKKFKEFATNPSICNVQDLQIILEYRDTIEKLEGKIRDIIEETENMKKTLSNVARVRVCFKSTEIDD